MYCLPSVFLLKAKTNVNGSKQQFLWSASHLVIECFRYIFFRFPFLLFLFYLLFCSSFISTSWRKTVKAQNYLYISFNTFLALLASQLTTAFHLRWWKWDFKIQYLLLAKRLVWVVDRPKIIFMPTLKELKYQSKIFIKTFILPSCVKMITVFFFFWFSFYLHENVCPAETLIYFLIPRISCFAHRTFCRAVGQKFLL